MKVLKLITLVLLILFIASPVLAQRSSRSRDSSFSSTRNRSLNVNLRNDHGIRILSFRGPRRTAKNPCFPFRCGAGITEPKTNPDPLKESEKTACLYDQKGILLYEREGKTCDYVKHFKNHEQRVEARRQEWLQARKESPTEGTTQSSRWSKYTSPRERDRRLQESPKSKILD